MPAGRLANATKHAAPAKKEQGSLFSDGWKFNIETFEEGCLELSAC